MKFDIPILLIVFNRPDKTKKILQILEKLEPKYLFISADGPRKKNKNDVFLCEEVKQIVSKINWECQLKTQFNKDNLSLKKNVIQSINWFFNNVEHGIILEDDCLPSLNFFDFCEKLLKKYQFDEKIMQINGSNGGLDYQNTNDASYFFSKINTTWGWASWKRAWDKFDGNFEDYKLYEKKNKILNYYEDQEISDWMKAYFEKSLKNVDNIWSTNWAYTILKNDGLCISPIKNLVENIGFDKSATSSNADHFLPYRKKIDESFEIKKYADKIEYFKKNDQNYFYNLIKKIDPRADRNSFKNRIKRIFYRIFKS
tara:strand:- start:15100 stop:16038 length:939 start_codon:yes stop_codon:yes gene_type:complete